MYKIAICDDNGAYVDWLHEQIKKLDNYYMNMEVYEYASGEALINDIDVEHNVIFLDVQMSGIDGNETARRLREVNTSAILVFCTGVASPSVDSFRVRTFRYILKDMNQDEIKTILIETFEEMIKNKKLGTLVVNVQHELLKVNVINILYIAKSRRGSSIVHFIDEKTGTLIEGMFDEPLDVVYDALSKVGFEYAHSSYLVNYNHVEKMNPTEVILDGNVILNVARSKSEKFRRGFLKYFTQ